MDSNSNRIQNLRQCYQSWEGLYRLPNSTPSFYREENWDHSNISAPQNHFSTPSRVTPNKNKEMWCFSMLYIIQHLSCNQNHR